MAQQGRSQEIPWLHGQVPANAPQRSTSHLCPLWQQDVLVRALQSRTLPAKAHRGSAGMIPVRVRQGNQWTNDYNH